MVVNEKRSVMLGVYGMAVERVGFGGKRI